MTALLERVPVDRITREARDAHPGVVVLTVIAAVLYGVGWLVAKAFGVVWLAAAWCGVAVKVGWQEARASRGGG